MNYSKEDFFALIEAAEGQGGQHLDKVCEARAYEFVGDIKPPPMELSACGNSALFEIPYESSFAGIAGVVKVCAVDDDMGRWPRFGGDKFASPEHYIKPVGE